MARLITMETKTAYVNLIAGTSTQNCGLERARTSDIFDVNEALYQLSYESALPTELSGQVGWVRRESNPRHSA